MKSIYIINSCYIFIRRFVSFCLLKDTRTSRCIVETGADASNSTDFIGCWLTIRTTSAVAFSAIGSSSPAAVSVAVTIYLLNFA